MSVQKLVISFCKYIFPNVQIITDDNHIFVINHERFHQRWFFLQTIFDNSQSKIQNLMIPTKSVLPNDQKSYYLSLVRTYKAPYNLSKKLSDRFGVFGKVVSIEKDCPQKIGTRIFWRFLNDFFYKKSIPKNPSIYFICWYFKKNQRSTHTFFSGYSLILAM